MISVVTGGAGFLGSALVRRLLQEGDTVRAIVLGGDRAADELRAIAAGEPLLEVVEGDVCAYESIVPGFDGAERAFHTAALVHAWAPRDRFRRVNVGGTQNVARAALAHGLSRLVHVSTSDVFGIPRGREPMDESSTYREWGEPYADTKIEAEKWLWQFHRESGLPLTVIYPGWIYGPGDRAFFPGLAEAIAGGLFAYWFRAVRLPWAYIDNMVDACLLASTHAAAVGRGYIVHDGMDGPTIESVCERIADTIGVRRPRRHVPYGLMLGAAAVVQGLWRFLRVASPPPLHTVDVKAFGFQWDLSNERIRRELGWTPRIPTAAGMERALVDLAARWKRSPPPPAQC